MLGCSSPWLRCAGPDEIQPGLELSVTLCSSVPFDVLAADEARPW